MSTYYVLRTSALFVLSHLVLTTTSEGGIVIINLPHYTYEDTGAQTG